MKPNKKLFSVVKQTIKLRNKEGKKRQDVEDLSEIECKRGWKKDIFSFQIKLKNKAVFSGTVSIERR